MMSSTTPVEMPVSMTGALAHDVYGRILAPKSTPGERMRMFKWCAVVVGAVSVLLGMQVEQLQKDC